MRVADHTKRHTYLRKGKLAICAFLAELPKSEHDVTSFTLDIPFATDRLMSFTVSGIFREPENQGGPAGQIIRHFSRVFVVVPQGQGFCIVAAVNSGASTILKEFYVRFFVNFIF